MEIFDKHNTHICLNCKKRLKEGEHCSCSDDKVTIYGNDISIDENGDVVCKCGSKKFTMNMHVNMSPKFYKSWICSKCGSLVGKETILSYDIHK